MQGASCLLRRCWTAGRLRLAGNRLLCRGGSWPCRPVACRGRGGEGTGEDRMPEGTGEGRRPEGRADRHGGGGS